MTLLRRTPLASDDPRRLRELLERCCDLANQHTLPSVVVGIAGAEGELLFPELIDYIESALRVEDAVFRMTRERAVLFVADVDRNRALEILERLLSDFRERFPTARVPSVSLGFFEVAPGAERPALKEVLPAVFDPMTALPRN
jgi:hypothetical protein